MSVKRTNYLAGLLSGRTEVMNNCLPTSRREAILFDKKDARKNLTGKIILGDGMQRKVLNFMVSLRQLPPLSSLSGQEERLLFDLLEAHQSGRTLLVRDAMNIGKLPPATTYRHVVALRKKGLIDFLADPSDARKKEIVFLPPAIDLLERLD